MVMPELLRRYHSPTLEVTMACCVPEAHQIPTYATLLGPSCAENATGSRKCFDVPEAFDEKKLVKSLMSLYEFFSFIKVLPMEYRLENHGNILKKDARGKELDSQPVIIFLTGQVLFSFPVAMKYVDMCFWLQVSDPSIIAARRFKAWVRDMEINPVQEDFCTR